jgi:SAM-dependent methyltransferase
MTPARTLMVGVAMVTTLVGTARAQQAPRLNRLFPPQELGLLEGPDRDSWQKPDQVMDALGIADGSHVADLGAGGGWFTVRLARRVGPNGLVYAEDIQPEMIRAITRRAQQEGLNNVRPILGAPGDPGLPSGQLDAALIVDSYAEMSDPVSVLRAVARALLPKGRLGVIEFRSGHGGPGPSPEQRVDASVITRDARLAGLQSLGREDFLDYQFLLIFGR